MKIYCCDWFNKELNSQELGRRCRWDFWGFWEKKEEKEELRGRRHGKETGGA